MTPAAMAFHTPGGIAFGPDGNLYVATYDSDQVLRFDGATGAFIDTFIPSGGGGSYLLISGGKLLINRIGTHTVALHDPSTGAFVRNFVSDPGPWGSESLGSGGQLGQDSWGLTIGPDGNLYVANYYEAEVLRYNGTTGAFIDTFVYSASGGLGAPVGLAFLPDGNLYVASNGGSAGNSVLKFNGTTGAFVGVAVPDGTPNLGAPQDLVFGADGKLYISTFSTNCVLRYDPTTNQTETFVQPGNPAQGSARQMAFGPDGNLYVTSQQPDAICRYNGATGEFIDSFVPSGSGGLTNPLGLAFGPDGNLYAQSFIFSPTFDGQVLRFNGTTGAFLDEFIPTGGIGSYLLFNPGVTQPETPGGSVTVSPLPTATIAYGSVTEGGQTTVLALDSATASVPANFKIAESTGGLPTYLNVNFSGEITAGSFIDLSLEYDPEQFPYDAGTGSWPNGRPELIHDPNDNGTWSDNATTNWVNEYGVEVVIGGNRILQGVDPVNHRVYGRTTSLSPFALVRRLAYQWSGVQQPVNQDGSSIFRLGSTVPVKFRLTGSDATNTLLQARLYVAKISNSVLGTEVEAVSTAAATSGNLFRYDPSTGNYVFNWSTKGSSAGTYRLRVDLGDGVEHLVQLSLR